MSDSKASLYIIEDEALIADHIAMCLEEAGYGIAGITEDGETALKEVEALRPDLCLLDIHLESALDGVDVAHGLNRLGIPFIYVTSNADPKTLARVKLTEPAGFILKPYTPEDLHANVMIALYKLQQMEKQAASKTEVPLTDQKPEIAEDSFFVKEKHELIRVRYQAVLYAQAMDNYTRLHTLDGKFVLSQTLKSVETKLEAHGFLRVHRSYLVNLRYVDLIGPRHLRIGKEELPVSERQRQALLDRIRTW